MVAWGVRFTHDDGYLISVGGHDNCVFVWKTDCIEEARHAQLARSTQTPPAAPTHAGDGKDEVGGIFDFMRTGWQSKKCRACTDRSIAPSLDALN